MRIVIMGTGPFAVPSAEKLLQDGHDCPLVVTRPVVDVPGKKRPPAPMFDWAKANGLPIFQPPSINDAGAITHLTKQRADLLFVCDYGQILSRDCLTSTALGGINLHGSLLPRHRGAAPVQWMILSGDREAGVSVIHITPKLDGGPILSRARTLIEADENALQLESRLALLGVEATGEAIRLLSNWDRSSPLGEVQDPALVSKAPRFSKSDGLLDFRLPADYLVRLIRALQPWPGTFAELQLESGKSIRLLIRAARSTEIVDEKQQAPGTVWSTTSSELGYTWPAPWHRLLAVQCPASLLLISQLQPAGKREMTAEDFLRGHVLGTRAHFSLPEPPCRQMTK